MILVAGGDSFIFGAELMDQVGELPSQFTYPAILTKQYKLKYDCVAISGNANNAISRTTMAACVKHLKNGLPVVALVTWTFTNRYEFRFNYHTGHKISPWYTINSWSIVNNIENIEKQFKTKNQDILQAQKQNLLIERVTGTAEFAKAWFKHVGDSEYFELYSSLKEILFLQYFFEVNHIPYLFVPADNNFYEHPNYYRRQDEHIDTLYNQIDWSKWYFFDPGSEKNQTLQPRGFYQWAVENKYPVGTTHPLEEAHAAAAELIKEKFHELVTKSLE